jgi:hypothetical protein
MALFDLHDWSLTVLVAALLAACLSLQGQPLSRGTFPDTAVCQKPGFPAMSLALSLH